MNPIIDEMLQNYDAINLNDKKNAIKEIMQEIVLCGLSRAGFFDKAVFYGGTALRIFYGLDRFSEDLDFSLRTQDSNFALEKYFPILEREINSLGLNVKIENKEKTFDSAIKSAFLKGNTKEHLLMFYSDDALVKGINPMEVIKIKFEIDTNPPPFATFETMYKLQPSPYEISLYDLPSLFAGKISAVLCRAWKNRVKGRDLYDYVFYLQKNATFNLKHLQARLEQAKFIESGQTITLDDVKTLLNKKFDSIDYEDAKKDVFPFIKNPNALNIWSEDFFKAITQNLKAE